MLRQGAVLYALPGLDQKQGHRARRVQSQESNARVDPGKSTLTSMSVAAVSSERADPFDDRGQAAEHLSNIGFDFGRKIASTRR